MHRRAYFSRWCELRVGKTALRGELQGPIEFYSCFISYSHADKSFADRLYYGLQMRGIRLVG